MKVAGALCVSLWRVVGCGLKSACATLCSVYMYVCELVLCITAACKA